MWDCPWTGSHDNLIGHFKKQHPLVFAMMDFGIESTLSIPVKTDSSEFKVLNMNNGEMYLYLRWKVNTQQGTVIWGVQFTSFDENESFGFRIRHTEGRTVRMEEKPCFGLTVLMDQINCAYFQFHEEETVEVTLEIIKY